MTSQVISYSRSFIGIPNNFNFDSFNDISRDFNKDTKKIHLTALLFSDKSLSNLFFNKTMKTRYIEKYNIEYKMKAKTLDNKNITYYNLSVYIKDTNNKNYVWFYKLLDRAKKNNEIYTFNFRGWSYIAHFKNCDTQF